MQTPSAERRQVEESLAGHGGDIYAIARHFRCDVDDFIDFSSNTHSFATRITEGLARDIRYPFEHYPDSDCHLLREALAVHEGCDAASILVGNGSSELIWLAMRSLAPRRVLFLGPMFSEYVRAAMLLDIEYEIITPSDSGEFVCGPKELKAIWDSKADLAVFCTPNNPGAVTYPNIQEMFEVLRIPRVLVDNTYREFLHGTPDYALNCRSRYLSLTRPGVAVYSMNSFTKFFVCPGVRLGYLTGDAPTLGRMAKQRPPWMVSPYAELLGLRLLENIDAYREALRPMRRQGEDMAVHLRRNPCFDPDRVFLGASFLTAALAGGVPASLAREKLLRRGLVVRNCDSIPGMPRGYLRMQVRPAADADRLLAALRWHGERGW